MAPIEPDLKEDFLTKFRFGAFFKRIFVYILPEMAPLCNVIVWYDTVQGPAYQGAAAVHHVQYLKRERTLIRVTPYHYCTNAIVQLLF